MSVPASVKLCSGFVAAAGVPCASYAVLDNYFLLNEIESKVLEKEGDWTIELASENATPVKVKTSVTVSAGESTSYSWECIVEGKELDSSKKDDFKNYLINQLNKSASKKDNRVSLVRYCARNRKPVDTAQAATHVKAEVSLVVQTLDGGKLSTSLLGEGSTTVSS